MAFESNPQSLTQMNWWHWNSNSRLRAAHRTTRGLPRSTGRIAVAGSSLPSGLFARTFPALLALEPI